MSKRYCDIDFIGFSFDYFWTGFWMIFLSIWMAKSFGAALFVGGIMLVVFSIVKAINSNT